MGLFKIRFIVDKKVNGYQGIINGNRDYKQVMILDGVVSDKGALCVEVVQVGIKKEMKIDGEVQKSGNQRLKIRYRVNEKLFGFLKFFRF